MPRVSKKAKIAAQRAKERIYTEAKIKRRKQPSSEIELGQKVGWIIDPLGIQKYVFFDGYKYWITIIPPQSEIKEIRNVSFTGLTQEQWEKRNKKEEKNG